jgi:hypothetical protein
MHHYIPVLAKNAGLAKVEKKEMSATSSPKIW